ncbi:DUF2694 family protein [Mycobacterium sp. D16R24]|uniref:DUF2694 family protein n=1 Tax=Mycobacterium sp. D16R24 TaxID=1855656 RepID=UPI000993D09C|nr:DUF2694 family protein [Mycobacterium sp. D16R24]
MGNQQVFRVVSPDNLLASTVDADGYTMNVQITENAMKLGAEKLQQRLTLVNRVAYLRSQATKRDQMREAGIKDIDPDIPTWDDVTEAVALLKAASIPPNTE